MCLYWDDAETRAGSVSRSILGFELAILALRAHESVIVVWLAMLLSNGSWQLARCVHNRELLGAAFGSGPNFSAIVTRQLEMTHD